MLHDIMTTCIILYNMIIEDERDPNAPIEVAREAQPPEVEMVVDDFKNFLLGIDKSRIKKLTSHFEMR